jgi:hypothetical protein
VSPKKEALEAIVTDPFTKVQIVAEYRGELRRDNEGWPKYKVYSPFFDTSQTYTVKTQLEAFRWVDKIKVLGPAPKEEDIVLHLNAPQEVVEYE